MIPYIPIICLILGLLLYALNKGEWKAIGLWMFACALLAILIAMAPATVKLLQK